MSAGEFVAVMGPSGCGKSTLLNLVAGLDTPTDGEIVLAGESLVGKDENELARMRREHIGIVFQFFNLLEGMTVLENVDPAGGHRRGAARARRVTAPRSARPARPRRQGERRPRRALGRPAPAPRDRAALANEPTILLADEPTGALDSEGGQEVLELFRRLHAGGQTILLVTHDERRRRGRGTARPHARRRVVAEAGPGGCPAAPQPEPTMAAVLGSRPFRVARGWKVARARARGRDRRRGS